MNVHISPNSGQYFYNTVRFTTFALYTIEAWILFLIQ